MVRQTSTDRVAVAARLCGLARDAVIVAIGYLTLHAAPPSVSALDAGLGVRAWSLMFIAGGIGGAVGLLTGRALLESAACFLIMGGWIIWTIAALQQPHVDEVSVAVALVFVAGGIGQFQQAVVAVAGVFTRGSR